MVTRRVTPSVSELRRRFEQRAQAPLLRELRDQLISLAGILKQPVLNGVGEEVGDLVDVITIWSGDDVYPAISGLVVRVGRRRAFVPAAHVASISPMGATLSSAQLDLREFTLRDREVSLAKEVLDHELVDLNGASVVRSADLYLAEVSGEYRLVGAEVGFEAILRRLGPARWRHRVTPRRVIDWADIQAFAPKGLGGARLSSPASTLRRLRPAQLAVMLERLRSDARADLLHTVDVGFAADALEEMDSRQVTSLLSEIAVSHAAELLAEMEPDEAAEALRDVGQKRRETLIAALPPDIARELSSLLIFGQHEAGGFMTTAMVLVKPADTVREVRIVIAEHVRHHGEIDAVIVVDADNRLIDDVTIVELFLAEPHQTIESLIGPPWPITVSPDADEEEVAAQLLHARHSSVIVIDGDGRPIGRVFTDDVIDALTGQAERWQRPRHH